ncbi:MAG: iron ABC transporter permease, partial [Thermofilum sp.]
MKVGKHHVWLLGLAIAAVYTVLWHLDPGAARSVDPAFWLACVAGGLGLYAAGYDYRWVKFSSGLSFLSVFTLMYNFF